MKKIFESEAISIFPCNRGFVFAEIHKEEISGKEKRVIAFHKHNFDTGITDMITKSAYLNNVFTNHTDFLKEEIEDYINVIAVFPPNLGMIIIGKVGIAKVYDYNCRFKWKGSLKYKGYSPADAVVSGDKIWCSYPDSNTLIRYNANSMRQEFKISSGISGDIKEPYGLFSLDNSIVITSQSSGVVQTMDLDNYNIEKMFEFNEPVEKYIKVDSNEIVLTKSGIYKL